ncbi:hypothetical protein C8R45DRAFT_945532 [Mycena sanguinolenta]|nr:hypothetical protein C8R45DRAFT_945532 [Mycena sanguinolenta]
MLSRRLAKSLAPSATGRNCAPRKLRTHLSQKHGGPPVLENIDRPEVRENERWCILFALSFSSGQFTVSPEFVYVRADTISSANNPRDTLTPTMTLRRSPLNVAKKYTAVYRIFGTPETLRYTLAYPVYFDTKLYFMYTWCTLLGGCVIVVRTRRDPVQPGHFFTRIRPGIPSILWPPPDRLLDQTVRNDDSSHPLLNLAQSDSLLWKMGLKRDDEDGMSPEPQTRRVNEQKVAAPWARGRHGHICYTRRLKVYKVYRLDIGAISQIAQCKAIKKAEMKRPVFIRFEVESGVRTDFGISSAKVGSEFGQIWAPGSQAAQRRPPFPQVGILANRFKMVEHSLMGEKDGLCKAAASLNTVRRKGKKLVDVPEDNGIAE